MTVAVQSIQQAQAHMDSKVDKSISNIRDEMKTITDRIKALETQGTSSGSAGPATFGAGLSGNEFVARPSGLSAANATFHTPPQSPKKSKMSWGFSAGDCRRTSSVPPMPRGGSDDER